MLTCQVYKWTKQVLYKKKGSSALVFLEEAANFGCQISHRNGHSLRCLFLTNLQTHLLKDCPISKPSPSLAATDRLFFFFLFVCVSFLFFKVTNQRKKFHIVFQEQLRNRGECPAGPGWALPSLCNSSASLRKAYSIHSLSVPTRTCTCGWAVICQLLPSSLPGLVTPCKTILYKFSLKFLILGSVFWKFRFHCRRENVWNKFRKQSWSHLNPLWSEGVQAFHDICHSWRCDLKRCRLGF